MTIKNMIKSILKPPYSLLLKRLEFIEECIITRNYSPSYSPIFIIGVPRSGTTLLYQIISYCFKVCYISNLMVKYSNIPCVFSYFNSLINGCDTPKYFNSWYGESSVWQAPNQGWPFWNRFFRSGKQNYIGLNGLDSQSILKLRNTILKLESIYNRPFVNKALSLGIRILPIHQALPEALFIRIHRDHLDVAQSILKGRKEYMQDKTRWFSAQPSEYDKIKDKDYITQICGQIFYIEKDMDRDIEQISKNRCFELHYKDLCKNPKRIINEIEVFYNQNTCNGVLEKKNEPPDVFKVSEGKKCADDEYMKLKECLLRFYEKKLDHPVNE